MWRHLFYRGAPKSSKIKKNILRTFPLVRNFPLTVAANFLEHSFGAFLEKVSPFVPYLKKGACFSNFFVALVALFPPFSPFSPPFSSPLLCRAPCFHFSPFLFPFLFPSLSPPLCPPFSFLPPLFPCPPPSSLPPLFSPSSPFLPPSLATSPFSPFVSPPPLL